MYTMDKERKEQCSQKGDNKELESLFIPSVHGGINMCCVDSLPVAQQVLLDQEAVAKFVPKCCFKRMNIAWKCFQNFAYVLFVKSGFMSPCSGKH